jgi:putative ABC transport system permease protein
MPISPRSSFTVGLQALRANPLRTLLSTLGIVMGVGAMVSVLSMGDGVEAFARAQIEETTDLLGVAIVPATQADIDGQLVRREDILTFTREDARALDGAVPGEHKVALVTAGAVMVSLDAAAAPRGFRVIGGLATYFRDAKMTTVAGRTFADTDTAVTVLNERAASVVARDSEAPSKAVGRVLRMNGSTFTVIGVVSGGLQASALEAYVPVGDAARAIPGTRAPTLALVAPRIEDVERLRSEAEHWMAARYGAKWKDRATVNTNQSRVAQVASVILVFKLLMGAITGVSLLVGGIGIMNVLLASVAERTREIGVRKATGARNRDVLIQFLSESVVITGAGAAAGVGLGLSIAFLAAAVMRAKTKALVHAAITPATILIAAGLSVAIGIAFGLYPALRAARLSPIEAIRHE